MSSTRAERAALVAPVNARIAVSSFRSIDYPQNSSLHEAFDGADADVARCEDVGSEAAAMNQFAHYAPLGESLQVGAGLTEPASDAFDGGGEQPRPKCASCLGMANAE
jgi:hypothetical protein